MRLKKCKTNKQACKLYNSHKIHCKVCESKTNYGLSILNSSHLIIEHYIFIVNVLSHGSILLFVKVVLLCTHLPNNNKHDTT